jgi:predicted nuclease of predicted toxin-antitoxin system
LIPILLDQGLPRSAAALLRQAGWDAQHVGECGLSGAPDVEILQYARKAGQAICTLDADFHAFLALSGDGGPSVIRIRREGLRGAEFAALLIALWPRMERAVTGGALVSISECALRFRYLPIGPTARY